MDYSETNKTTIKGERNSCLHDNVIFFMCKCLDFDSNLMKVEGAKKLPHRKTIRIKLLIHETQAIPDLVTYFQASFFKLTNSFIRLSIGKINFYRSKDMSGSAKLDCLTDLIAA